MLAFRQFLGNRVVQLGRGLLRALLADEDRPGSATGRVPHERDRDRAQPIGAPGPRFADLRPAGREVLLHRIDPQLFPLLEPRPSSFLGNLVVSNPPSPRAPRLFFKEISIELCPRECRTKAVSLSRNFD